ncbi:MAG: hypothetical protein COW12_05995 [Candidatus Omnitrophica bacterium CG12_big_fil_rev_8_21_14_0_65_45_16]|nr:MAG: hypothetical protein COW12_05995 [Candidatus Omnitrophica bacterium CG12_big_fil_rev_8_21_14_0_65_45_16]
MLRFGLLFGLTVIFFPIYYYLRRPFFKLPLHRDTGFYVSNQTICERRFNYKAGWNAHFAFCSKVIPELFYSLIYLKYGGASYDFQSRRWLSFFNYMTAVAVALCAYVVAGNQWAVYIFALAAYALLSSHPHAGVYFESAEQFEPFFQIIAFAAVWTGIFQHEPWWLFAGISIWFLNGFLIKTSSLAVAILTALYACYIQTALSVLIVTAVLLSLIFYVGWVYSQGKRLKDFWRPSVRHEHYWHHHISTHQIVTHLLNKCAILMRGAVTGAPFIFLCACAGLLVKGFHMPLLVVYLTGCVIVYFIQVGRIWYYVILFLPPLALLSGLGMHWIIEKGGVLGWGLWAVGLGLDVTMLYLRSRGDTNVLNQRVWQPYGQWMAKQNRALQAYIDSLDMKMTRGTLWVFGVCNQAYVMLERAYPSPYISGALWLDFMDPDWQLKLARSFVQQPPDYILATDECFCPEQLKNQLHLTYKCISTFEAFKLYELEKGQAHPICADQVEMYDTKRALQLREAECY